MENGPRKGEGNKLTCRTCNITRVITEFRLVKRKNKTTNTVIRLTQCKTCYKTYLREWSHRNGVKPRLFRVKENGRLCATCDVFKPYEEFYKRPSGPNGRSSECISCASIREKQYRAKYYPIVIKKAKAWREKHRDVCNKNKRDVRASMPDEYIKHLLKLQGVDNPPDTLVACWRSILRVKRSLRKLNNVA